MGYDRQYHRLRKSNERSIDKDLGFRYRNSNEALPGETYTSFKTRIIKEELQSIQEQANKVYPAWVRMPGETEKEFRRRLTATNPADPPTFPAWKKMPGESEEEFQKRFTSKKLDTNI